MKGKRWSIEGAVEGYVYLISPSARQRYNIDDSRMTTGVAARSSMMGEMPE